MPNFRIPTYGTLSKSFFSISCKRKGKVNWVKLLCSVPYLLITVSLAIGLDFLTLLREGHHASVFCTTSLLPTLPELVPIYTPLVDSNWNINEYIQKRRVGGVVRVECLAQRKNLQPLTELKLMTVGLWVQTSTAQHECLLNLLN